MHIPNFMAKKSKSDASDDTTAQDTSDVKTELTAPNVVPNLADEIITLQFKQNAYWLGTLRMQGEKMDLPRAEAQELLRTSDLFIAVGK